MHQHAVATPTVIVRYTKQPKSARVPSRSVQGFIDLHANVESHDTVPWNLNLSPVGGNILM